MSSRDENRYFDALRKYEKKLNKEESFQYKMLLKRHKDEEELDRLSLDFLKDLYVKYHLNREKKNIDDLLKKYQNED